MTINEFWNIVKRINWLANCTQRRYYYDAKKMLMHEYSPETMKEFSDQFCNLKAALSDCIDAYDEATGERVGNYGGDDSFDDMLSHVVGCGKDAYDAVLKDPTILNEMKYVESFAYCIPYGDDYQNIDPAHYQKWAREAITELASIVQANDIDAETADTIKDIMARMLFMVSGNFTEATRGFTKTGNGTTYTRYCNFKGNTSYARFANVISDCKQYMVKK